LQALIRLSEVECKRLIREGRKTKDAGTERRCLMVARVAGGKSCRWVAKVLLGCAVSTVVTAVRRFIAKGAEGLIDRRRMNGPRKVDDGFLATLKDVLLHSPPDFGWRRPTWTRELLCLELQRRGLPRVAPCTMGRALSRIGARLGRPRPVVLCPWSRQKRTRRLFELLRLAARSSPKEPVFYVDEVDVHLNPKLGRDWMLPGRQRLVVTPGQNEKHYLAGALEARAGKLTCVDGTSKSSELFIKLVWRLMAANRTAHRVHLILDNYIIHSSRMTRRALRHWGTRLVLHFLPPYCPEANRIERTWLDLHANVTRNHRRSTMKELLRDVSDFLRAYNRREQRNPALRRAHHRAA
jgi:transposase